MKDAVTDFSPPVSLESPGIAPEPVRKNVAELYEQRRELVYRSVLALARDADDAEEITQEAFLKLYERYAAGDIIDDAVRWLLTVSRRVTIDRFRRRRNQPLTGALLWNAVTRTRADDSPTPEQVAITRAAPEELLRALDKLGDIEKECLILRSQGAKLREIAAKLNIPNSTTGKHIERAIRKVQGYLK